MYFHQLRGYHYYAIIIYLRTIAILQMRLLTLDIIMLKHVGASLSYNKDLISFNNIPSGNNVPASCAREKPDVLSVLSLLDFGGSDGIYTTHQSLMSHHTTVMLITN